MTLNNPQHFFTLFTFSQKDVIHLASKVIWFLTPDLHTVKTAQ